MSVCSSFAVMVSSVETRSASPANIAAFDCPVN